MLAGGIYLSAHIPEHVALGPAIALLAASALLLVANLVSLRARRRASPGSASSRSPGGRCSPTSVIAGMIEYVFLRNRISGGPLVVLSLSLVVFAVQVPVLIAFTVARYAVPAGTASEQASL